MLANLKEAQTVWVAGFGITSIAGVHRPALKNFVRAPVISASCSRANWRANPAESPETDEHHYKCRHGHELVTLGIENANGTQTDGGACFGDSGGGVFATPKGIVPGSTDDALYLIAIVSRPVKNCDPEDPQCCKEGVIYTLIDDAAWSDLDSMSRNIAQLSFPRR